MAGWGHGPWYGSILVALVVGPAGILARLAVVGEALADDIIFLVGISVLYLGYASVLFAASRRGRRSVRVVLAIIVTLHLIAVPLLAHVVP